MVSSLCAGAQSDRAAITVQVDHDVRNISFVEHNVTEAVHGLCYVCFYRNDA